MNLRKDHCRNLPSRATREHVYHERGSGESPFPTLGRCFALAGHLLGTITNPGAVCAKEHKYMCALLQPVCRLYRWHQVVYNIKRLSATDISALASMKNVAKCDTWCELQNPVNHRVFERKLRPKPLGRGHACLGVTHRVSPHPP